MRQYVEEIRLAKREWFVLIFATLLLFFNYSYVFANVGLGGLITEKLLDRSGVASSQLSLSRNGQATSPIVAMGGIVTTSSATIDRATGIVTLNGNLTNLNGMPQADVYFDWGYTPACGTTTTLQPVVATGSYSAILSGLEENRTLYFRGVVDTDGTNYGNVNTIITRQEVGSILLKQVLPIVVAGVIIVGGFFVRAPYVSIIIGVIAFIIIQQLLGGI